VGASPLSPCAVGRYQADYKRWLQAGQVPQEEQLLLQAVLAVQVKQWEQALSTAAAALRLLRTQVCGRAACVPALCRLRTAYQAARVVICTVCRLVHTASTMRTALNTDVGVVHSELLVACEISCHASAWLIMHACWSPLIHPHE